MTRGICGCWGATPGRPRLPRLLRRGRSSQRQDARGRGFFAAPACGRQAQNDIGGSPTPVEYPQRLWRSFLPARFGVAGNDKLCDALALLGVRVDGAQQAGHLCNGKVPVKLPHQGRVRVIEQHPRAAGRRRTERVRQPLLGLSAEAGAGVARKVGGGREGVVGRVQVDQIALAGTSP